MTASETTSAVLDEALEEQRPVRVWIHDFTLSEVRRLARAIELVGLEKQGALPVFILSEGGSLHELFAMLDLFAACPVPVATIALGTAQSAALDLLAAGTRGHRFVAPSASIMLHDSSDGWSSRKIPDVESYAKQARAERDRSFRIFERHTGKKRGFWDRYLKARQNADVFLTAEQCVELGIADHVGVPVLDDRLENLTVNE